MKSEELLSLPTDVPMQGAGAASVRIFPDLFTIPAMNWTMMTDKMIQQHFSVRQMKHFCQNKHICVLLRQPVYE